MSQQKKAIIKQRVTSSVSIFLISPYFTIRIKPRAAIPTTTMDHPIINHLKKSDTTIFSFFTFFSNYGNMSEMNLTERSPNLSHCFVRTLPLPLDYTSSLKPGNWVLASQHPPLLWSHSTDFVLKHSKQTPSLSPPLPFHEAVF